MKLRSDKFKEAVQEAITFGQLLHLKVNKNSLKVEVNKDGDPILYPKSFLEADRKVVGSPFMWVEVDPNDPQAEVKDGFYVGTQLPWMDPKRIRIDQ